MKIKCNYCGSMFNDTAEKCPNCGAPNEGVVRTTKSQPQTIEELAQWYADRGLPPYETTRFFIGKNYTGKRAFGIYKDEKTGNFVVYKNKDSGQRAIRYEGTDEAYAVNELFMRLKEEIIQQKAHNVEKKSGGSSNVKTKASNSQPKSGYQKKPRRKNFWDWYENLGCFSACGVLLAMLAILIGLIVGSVWTVGKIVDQPERGYYQYEEHYMYYARGIIGFDENAYVTYNEETDTWSDPVNRKKGPDELRNNKTAQKYFIAEKWNKNIGCPDYLKSQEYINLSHNTSVDTGYYKIDDKHYYHSTSSVDYGWYEYDSTSSWQPIEASEIPEDLTYHYSSRDFYYTPYWSSETQITDFKDSDYYVAPSYSSSDDDDDFWSWDNDNDDSSYDWDYSYDWDSNSTDWDSDW